MARLIGTLASHGSGNRQPVAFNVDYLVVAGGGISTGATPASPELRVANSMATALKIAADSWIVIGDIA